MTDIVTLTTHDSGGDAPAALDATIRRHVAEATEAPASKEPTDRPIAETIERHVRDAQARQPKPEKPAAKSEQARLRDAIEENTRQRQTAEERKAADNRAFDDAIRRAIEQVRGQQPAADAAPGQPQAWDGTPDEAMAIASEIRDVLSPFAEHMPEGANPSHVIMGALDVTLTAAPILAELQKHNVSLKDFFADCVEKVQFSRRDPEGFVRWFCQTHGVNPHRL